jgi:hypothetical protein
VSDGTARTEAIEAITRLLYQPNASADVLLFALHRPKAERIVDALSGGLLARLAADKGGLEDTGQVELVRRETLSEGRVRNHFRPVYRIVDPS